MQEKTKSKALLLDSTKSFDVIKYIRPISPFQEKEVDNVFSLGKSC